MSRNVFLAAIFFYQITTEKLGFGVETLLRRFGKSRSPGNSAGDLVGMVK